MYNRLQKYHYLFHNALFSHKDNETGSRSPCMRPRSDPPEVKNSTADKIVAEKQIKKKQIKKRIGW